jgi:mono/diheme cytochrome c family protein/plastocyanin
MNKLQNPGGDPTTTPRMERLARSLAVLLLIGFPLAIVLVAPKGAPSTGKAVEIHAKMPEQGGWSVANLTATAGQPLHLRLVSDDVVHGFKIGQSDEAAIDLLPGKSVETTLTFDRPGKYTYYCTRWCGPNHWRMRGTIDVLPAAGSATQSAVKEAPPLYVSLGLDIDAPHPAQVTPQTRPSARRGAALNFDLPQAYRSQTFYRTHSPAEAWEILRNDPATQTLDDQQTWDLVALIWSSNMSRRALEAGRALYAQNCAACHGENGAGDGVFAAELASKNAGVHPEISADSHNLKAPADFTDPSNMLGASPALLNGKIVRGGMGTGMPYWGPIFSEDQIWALVDALYATQFNLEVEP